MKPHSQMLKKFLKEVISLVVGKQAEEIADLLDSKKHVNEFIIAKKLDMTINQTRNILYKLSDKGLVSSLRKKDKKKGWYTYFWKIETIKSLEFLKESLKQKISQIDHQIKSRETKQFYVCDNCNVELTEENALLYNFTCNECGRIFTLKDNSKVLKEIKKQKDKIEEEIKEIDLELNVEKGKEEKKRDKETKKLEKEKKAERSIKMKKLKKARELEKKKNLKKDLKVKKPLKIKKVKKRKIKKISRRMKFVKPKKKSLKKKK
jgi:transcription factor E